MKKPLKEPKPKSGWQVILAVFILLVSCSPRNHTHYSVDDPRRSYNNTYSPVKPHKPSIKK